MNGPYLGIDAIANYFGVSPSTIRQWVRGKKIPDTCYIKVGMTYRFHLPATQDALVNYKHREGMTDEQRAKLAEGIINNLEGVIADDKPVRASEETIQSAETKLENKVQHVPNLKADHDLDDELAGILAEHDDLQDL